MNGLMSYETDDISNSDAIQSEIKELLDDLSIDINDDFERDYRNNYDGREFLVENDMMFSNIAIEYLSIHDAILTKMQNIDDDDKMRSLVIALEQDYKIKELSLEQITNLLDEFGYEPSDEDIEIINDFINAYNENELFDDLW